MKLKALLPIPRRGQTISDVDPQLSFYDLFYNELLEHGINMAEHYLVDGYGRYFSYVLPLAQQNCYSGMSLELKKLPELELDTARLEPFYQMQEQICVRFNMAALDAPSFEVFCRRGSIVRDLIYTHVELSDPEYYEIRYCGHRYALSMTLLAIGAADRSQFSVFKRDNDEVAPADGGDSALVTESGETTSATTSLPDDSQHLSVEEYQGMLRERRHWEIEHGIGMALSPEVKRALYEQRASQKGELRFKLIQGQFGLRGLAMLKMKPLQTVEELFRAVQNHITLNMAKNGVSEELIADFAAHYYIFRLNNAYPLSPSDIELFEAFYEGDAQIDVRWAGGNIAQLMG